jgi:uncharacterized protein (DUF58 family)
MTARGAAIAVLAIALGVVGWLTGWPELTALGGGGVVLVLVCVVLCGSRPHGEVVLEHASLRVVRGEDAAVRLRIHAPRRRRWMRVADRTGASSRLSTGAGARINPHVPSLTSVPVNTSIRGVHPVGPYSLVHGDPWSIVRRVVHQSEAGVITVVPRTYPVSRRRLQSASAEDSMSSSNRVGDEHFYALRDYVFGDEPRSVHWRSSARVGHLVVRQQVAAAKTGTTVVLDCDITAYGQDDQFGAGWVSDRFEAAVEVAASIVVSDLGRNERIHLASTTRQSALVSSTGASRGVCLDALAAVGPAPPVETDAVGLLALVRRTRCARVIVVTGTPHGGLIDAARRIRRAGTAVTLVRVGASGHGGVDGIDVLDVARATELSEPPP